MCWWSYLHFVLLEMSPLCWRRGNVKTGRRKTRRTMIGAKICALMVHIRYDLYTKRHPNHPTWPKINAKALAMSLIYTLEIDLRFKGRKLCKLNDFRFWKIKKGLNEEISESRFIECKERQNKDIMRLEDNKWPLWSKKEGKKAWEMRHEARFSYMEI